MSHQKGPNSSAQQCPTSCHKINASKVEPIWLFHNQQEAEDAFQEFLESQSMDFFPLQE